MARITEILSMDHHTVEKVSLDEKFEMFSDHWNPRIVGELNGQAVKVAKVKGPFVWHKHENEDELFFVVKGTLVIEFRDKAVSLNKGDLLIVPRGVEHKPMAEDEAWIMLFEPLETRNTGEKEVKGLTRKDLDRI